VNKVIIIGNLGSDVEFNYTPSGTAVAKFSVAVNDRRKSKDGEAQDNTTWFRVVAWQKLAETCSSYLKKGNKVYIEGRLDIRKYQDKNGIDRTSVEIVASDLEFLTPRSQSSNNTDSSIEDLGELEDHPF
jgi:single-strand DNA-binding protein